MSHARKSRASEHVLKAYDELLLAEHAWQLSMIHSLRAAVLSCYFAIQELPSAEDYTPNPAEPNDHSNLPL